jgi:hypothetical protein
MRRFALLAIGAIALLGACGRGGKDDNSFRLQLDGSATITTSTSSRSLASGSHKLAVGETLRMVKGTGALELPGDRSLLVRGGVDASVVEIGTTPSVVDGAAVAVSGDDALRVTAGDVDIRVDGGAARVQRGLSVTVAMYRGSADVRSAGQKLDGGLPALRQVSVPATGALPRDPQPLVYDTDHPDAWDLQFLGDAIDLGRELDGRSRGLTGQLGPRARVDTSLLKRVLPPLASESFQLDGEPSPGEAVVGAAIVVEGHDGGFRQRWDDVVGFRDDGATWGLVALDQQVKRDALAARLDDAASRSPLLFAAGPARTRSTTPRSTSTTTTTRRGTSGGGPSTTTTTQPPAVPPTTIGPISIPGVTVPDLSGGTAPPPSDPGTSSDGIIGAVVGSLIGSTTTTSTTSTTTTTAPPPP